MLEKWFGKEESLRLMFRHYKDGTLLPKEMSDKLVASNNANAGGFNLRQVFLATFDQRLHTLKGAPNTAELIKDTYMKIVGIDIIPGSNFAAIFGHLGQQNDNFTFKVFENSFQLVMTHNITATCGPRSTARTCSSPGSTRRASSTSRPDWTTGT